MLRVGVVAIVMAGCYRPAGLADCSLTCDTTCPGNMECGSDQLCHTTGSLECSQQMLLDASTGDGALGVDADPSCVGSQTIVPTCIAPMTDVLTITTNLDTDTDPRCLPPAGGSMCMVLAHTIFANSFRASGSRVLALVATGELTLSGVITADSTSTIVNNGPGSLTPCSDANASAGHPDAHGGGGGAGGSFQGLGGPGGTGGGGAAGVTNAVIGRPTTLRAGCPGTSGGTNASGTPIDGGLGGGGVAFVASTITIAQNAVINASGAGGFGGPSGFGAGGGGSGGLIVFDAGTTSFGLNARIFADGGGGGGGGGSAKGGDNGGESTGNGASGGSGDQGIDGGAGSHDTVLTGTAGTQSGVNGDGGGGGGGGAGWILVIGGVSDLGASFSPPRK